jgi:hypothetical protein
MKLVLNLETFTVIVNEGRELKICFAIKCFITLHKIKVVQYVETFTFIVKTALRALFFCLFLVLKK